MNDGPRSGDATDAARRLSRSAAALETPMPRSGDAARRRRALPGGYLAAALVLTAAVLTAGAAGAQDTLFTGGRIWTGDPANPGPEAVLVRGDRIVEAGPLAAAERRMEADARRVDLDGGMLLPGFVESHTHPGVAGLLGQRLSVVGTRTVAEVQAALREYAAAHPDEPVIFGFGFPSALNTATNAAGVTGPWRGDLDAVISDRPVLILALDAHSAWLNSRALEAAGVTRDTPDPIPGAHYYQRDADGEPTGWAVEGATFWPLLPVFGVGSEEDLHAAYSQMLPALSGFGITTVFEAGIPGGLTRNALSALARLERAGRLPLRIRSSAYVNGPREANAEFVDGVLEMRREFGSALIDLNTVKIPNDGTFEGLTAAVLEPYASGGGGAVLFSEEELTALLTRLREAGLDAHVHAIGDRTLREALNAVAAAREAVPVADSRVTVAHAMLAAPSDLARLRPFDVAVQTTPHWAHDLQGSFGLYAALMDAERSRAVMRLRDLQSAAVSLAFAADFPATGMPFPETSPLFGIEIGMTRRAPGAETGEPLPPADQRLTLEEMLRGYTAGGARQVRLEDEAGVIAPGRLADLVVLGDDLFEMPPHRIHEVPVVLTMVGGRVVFEQDAEAR